MDKKYSNSKHHQLARVRCRYSRCRQLFRPAKRGQLYCCGEHRSAAWRMKSARVPTALSRSFQLLGVEMPAPKVATIIDKLSLEMIETWLKFYVAIDWFGAEVEDFVDILSGAG